MKANYTRVHLKFKLNGISISYDELDEISYSLIKEGDDYEGKVGQFLLDWIDSNDYITLQTSGSTGVPKLITLKKQHMVNSALATGDFFNLKAGDSALLCLSVGYIAGKMMLVRAMVLGLELDFVEPSANPLFELKNKSYDFCAMVPLQVENSLARLDQIKNLIVGGAPISQSLKEKVKNIKTQVYETYGMTETASHIALKKINRFSAISASPLTLPAGRQDVLRSGPSENPFKTLVNITVTKDNRDCLIINAPNIATEPIVTNDVVSIISDTEFEWLGRYDNVINSGGVKLIPEQIETKLAPLLESRFFIAGLPDEKLGQKLTLILEREDEIIGLLESFKSLKGLEEYELPKEILNVSHFMETENGKISRKKTLDQILGI